MSEKSSIILKYALFFMSHVFTLIFGIAVGVILMQAGEDNPHFEKLEKITSPNKLSVKSFRIQQALRYNQENNALKIVGWTTDGRYPIYNIKTDPVNPAFVYIGKRRELRDMVFGYNITQISDSDIEADHIKCNYLCTDWYGNYIGIVPRP